MFFLCALPNTHHPSEATPNWLVGWWVACCSAGGWQPCRWGSGIPQYWQRCHNQRARTVCVLCVSEYYSKKHYCNRCITTVCVISSFSLLSLFFLFLSLFRQLYGQFEYRNATSTQIIPQLIPVNPITRKPNQIQIELEPIHPIKKIRSCIPGIVWIPSNRTHVHVISTHTHTHTHKTRIKHALSANAWYTLRQNTLNKCIQTTK